MVEVNHGEQFSSHFPENFVAYLLKCTASDSKGAKAPFAVRTVASHIAPNSSLDLAWGHRVPRRGRGSCTSGGCETMSPLIRGGG